MPTTSLPGIGASIRIERAARAIARSSARASMRETLTWCSGRTSYWVTTGPELTATTLAGIAKLSSFSSIRRDVRLRGRARRRRRPPVAARAGRSSAASSRSRRATRGRSAASPASAIAARRAAAAPTAPASGAGRQPPSGAPVQTVWLTGDWPDRGRARRGCCRRRRLAARASGGHRHRLGDRRSSALGRAVGGRRGRARSRAAVLRAAHRRRGRSCRPSGPYR